MKREKELALTLAVKLVEQDKSITDSTKMANASVEVAKILEQYLKENTPESYKNPYEQAFMVGNYIKNYEYTPSDSMPTPEVHSTHTTCKGCEGT